MRTDGKRNGRVPGGERGLSCREVLDLVTEYLERALPQDQRRRFQEHIRLCPACDAYLAQMQRTIEALGELREDSLAPHQRDRLLSAFRGWQRQ